MQWDGIQLNRSGTAAGNPWWMRGTFNGGKAAARKASNSVSTGVRRKISGSTRACSSPTRNSPRTPSLRTATSKLEHDRDRLAGSRLGPRPARHRLRRRRRLHRGERRAVRLHARLPADRLVAQRVPASTATRSPSASARCTSRRRDSTAILAFDLDRASSAGQCTCSRTSSASRAVPSTRARIDGPLHAQQAAPEQRALHAGRHVLSPASRPAACCSSTAVRLQMAVELPPGTHNARPFRDGVLFNDTEADRAALCGRAATASRIAPSRCRASTRQRLHESRRWTQSGVARPGFARGLARAVRHASSRADRPLRRSPSTTWPRTSALLSVNLTLDVRNAIHGLEPSGRSELSQPGVADRCPAAARRCPPSIVLPRARGDSRSAASSRARRV